MNFNENSQKQNFLLKRLQQNDSLALENELKDAIVNRTNTVFENKAPYRSSAVHKTFLGQSFNSKLFVRGLRSDIFDDYSVVSAFSARVASIISENIIDNDDYIVELLIKEDEYNIRKNLNDSLFYNEIRNLRERYNRNIMEVTFIDPKTKIIPPFCFQITDLDFNIVSNNESVAVSDVESFGIFDNKFIRVRKDVRSGHESEAMINCGLSEDKVNHIIETFYYMKSCGVKHPEFNI